jgi:hypothetical protein
VQKQWLPDSGDQVMMEQLDRVVEDQDTDTPRMIHVTQDLVNIPAVSLCGSLLFGPEHPNGTPIECVVCAEIAAAQGLLT